MNNIENYNGPSDVAQTINDSPNVVSVDKASNTLSQTLTTFDDTAQPEVSSSNMPLGMPILGPSDGSISEFFSRPVKIYSGDATTTTLVTLDPLMLYLSNPTVKRKTDNFMFMRATVCVRYSETPMPFVYGCRQISAEPWKIGGLLYESATFPEAARSNLQCGYTNPTTGEPIVMKLPFINNGFYHRISNVNTGDPAYTWKVYITSMLQYQRCDSATAPVMTCSVHVWLEDVVLDVPIATDTLQSEYHGVVSQPASIIGNASKMLSNIPVLKPFMQPVVGASNMIAKFAHNMGFSKPNQLEAPIPVFNNPDQNMSCATGLDVAQKLTIDPKQGCVVDSNIIDGSTKDNLAFETFFERETIVQQFSWTSSNPVGHTLLVLPVTPCLCPSNSAIPAHAIPILPFRFWRGDVKFKIKIIASAYHRGRLRVYFSPTALSGTLTEDIFNQLESCVIDINSVKEYDIDVNFMSQWPWKNAVFRKPSYVAGVDSLIPVSQVSGYLYFRVSQELNAPLNNAPVKIYIFSSCPGMEVAGKSGLNLRTFHKFPAPTSGSVIITGPAPVRPTIAVSNDPQFQSLEIKSGGTGKHSFNRKTDLTKFSDVTVGSRVTSFRELCKTWQLYEESNFYNYQADPGTVGAIVKSFPLIPLLPGGQLMSPPSTYGVLAFDNPITLLSSVFRGFRGGMRWKLVFDVPVDTLNLSVSLIRNQPGKAVEDFLPGDLSSGSQWAQMWDNNAIAVQQTGNTITFEIPYEYTRTFYPLPSTTGIGYLMNAAYVRIYNKLSGTVYDKINYRAYVSFAEDTTYGLFVGFGMAHAYDVFPLPVTALNKSDIGSLTDRADSKSVNEGESSVTLLSTGEMLS